MEGCDVFGWFTAWEEFTIFSEVPYIWLGRCGGGEREDGTKMMHGYDVPGTVPVYLCFG